MLRPRPWPLAALAIGLAVLACSIPPEIVDALYRLPTPTATATPVPSTVLYVATTGSDSNDCLTAATPCLTIEEAVRKAADGAAIYVGPGTYAENDTRSLDTGLWIRDKSVSLYGAGTPGGLTTILTGSGALDTVAVTGDVDVVLERMVMTNGRAGLVVGGDASVTLREVEIRDNAWMGVRVFDGVVVLENALITGHADGAIDNEDGGDLTLRSSRVVSNGTRSTAQARELGLPNAVIYTHGILHLIDTTVADNADDAAEQNALISNWGTLTIERSTISGNRMGRGAAVYTPNGSGTTVANSTISGNSGAGILAVGADVRLSYVTIAGNGGGGLYGNAGEGAPMTLRFENTLIVNNEAQDCYYQLGHTIVFDRRGRNISDGSCRHDYGGNFTRPPEGDAFLEPLADNGGPTHTHALLEGSLAIDAAEGPCLATDQRGSARPVGGGCDVGAFEFNFALTAATPAETPIPIWTATPEGTATPGAPPPLTLLQDANCRKGPGARYDALTSLTKGTQSPALGRDEGSTWWLLQVPQTEIQCWVSGISLEGAGEEGQVPVVAVAPLPGTPADFQVNQSTCSANLNAYPVDLGWGDTSGETGYRLYRNGTLVTTLGANAASHTDQAPKATELTYELEAFNGLGKSARASLSVSACP